MKKNLLLLTVTLLFAVIYSQAQVLYSDDFESYTVGQGIAAQSSTWDTWSGAPGTPEDVTVSDAQALSGDQSVRVFGTNDGVIVFDDLTTGRYRVEFYMYVPAGRQGYYNIMQNFNPSGAGLIWGMQAFWRNGNITIDGAGAAAVVLPYQADSWVKVQHFIDLNSDWIDMYIDDVLVHAYQWSKGTFNNGTGVNKLDAFNFYAWNEGGTCEYFMDDFLIEEVETPYAPANFSYEIVNDNDVVLTWEAPAEGTPENYSIARNGVVIGSTSELTFTDLNVYPNAYQYSLLAFYGTSSGYSAPMNLNVTIDGGNPREFVLFELFTSVNCVYCPYATQALDQVHADGNNVLIIEYHGNGLGPDPFALVDTDIREQLYVPLYDEDLDGFGYPTSIFNGTDGMEGAVTDVAQMKELYMYYYEEEIAKPSLYTITSSVEQVGESPYIFNLDIAVEETFAYFTEEMRLFIAVTETDIPHSWQGQPTVNFLNRGMIPDANGILLDFSENAIYSNDFEINIPDTYNVDKCKVIMFVQNMVTGHIQQASRRSLISTATNIEDNIAGISLFPNPANNHLNIIAENKIEKVQIVNIAGQLTTNINVNADNTQIDISNLAAGIYFVKVNSNNNISIHKLIVE